MSVQAITCALALRGVSPAEKLVLLALANYADEHLICWPSQKRLADDCCMTERGVRGILASLEKQGLIERSQRRRDDGYRASDRFVLRFSPEQASAENASAERPSDLTGTKQQFSPERGSGLTTLEPSVEPPLEPSLRARARPTDFHRFWSAYPNKVGKRLAEAAYGRAVKRADPETILAGLERANGRQWAESLGNPPHPTTWLNGDRWEDAPSETARGPPAISFAMQDALVRETGFKMALAQARERDANRGNHQRDQGVVHALPAPRSQSG